MDNNITGIGLPINENGFPACPKCGGILHWNSDFMASELGLIDEEDIVEDEIVNCLTCIDCNRDFYHISQETGPKFIDVSTY